MAATAKTLFTLRRVDTNAAVTIAADFFIITGTPSGWLVEFVEWVEEGGGQVIVPRRAYAIPASVAWDVVEEETTPTMGVVH